MEIVRQALAILLVFALLGAAIAGMRRKSWRGRVAPALLQSRGKLALTTRHSIHLVRIGDRDLILALHPAGITFLGDVTSGEFAPDAGREPAATPAISGGAI